MKISFTGSPSSPELSIVVSVGESYPTDKPTVTVIAFRADDKENAFVLGVPYGEAGPVVQVDVLTFIKQYLP